MDQTTRNFQYRTLLLLKRGVAKQWAKHGGQFATTPERWMVILVEEFGELAQAYLNGNGRLVDCSSAAHAAFMDEVSDALACLMQFVCSVIDPGKTIHPNQITP